MSLSSTRSLGMESISSALRSKTGIPNSDEASIAIFLADNILLSTRYWAKVIFFSRAPVMASIATSLSIRPSLTSFRERPCRRGSAGIGVTYFVIPDYWAIFIENRWKTLPYLPSLAENLLNCHIFKGLFYRF